VKLVSTLAAGAFLAGCATPAAPVENPVRGDSMPEPLTAAAGDPARGREIVIGREANCLLCHAIAETGQRFMGDVGPTLSGVGSRLSAGQIRLRIVDPTRVKPDIAMPAYHRTRDLDRVAEPDRGKPVLSAQQVEDVVAYLTTLR
jgi:sulfur-oxidizing protein SoxX